MKKAVVKVLLVLLVLVMLPVVAMAFEGSGTSADPYLIQTKADLAQLAAYVNGGTSYSGKYFKLANDINLNNEEWTPIGNSSSKFQGHFDGNNKTISNLNVSMAGKNNAGLFGYTTNGSVKNLTVENAKVTGRLNVGVVAGTPYTTKYSNITVKGHVEVNGMAYVGGVFGKNVYADVTNVTVDADESSYVRADSVENGTAYRTYVGGVIGFMGEGGHTVSNVTSNIDVYGNVQDIGGITGIAHYNNNFENCTNTGNLIFEPYSGYEAGEDPEIGGIAGVWHNQDGTTVDFKDCEFTGEIIAPEGTPIYNNGLVGSSYNKPTDTSGTMDLNGNTVKNNDTVEYMKPAVTPSYSAPKTGDNSQLLLWAGLMIVAMMGMITLGKKRAAADR